MSDAQKVCGDAEVSGANMVGGEAKAIGANWVLYAKPKVKAKATKPRVNACCLYCNKAIKRPGVPHISH